jgi:hypothetical protein
MVTGFFFHCLGLGLGGEKTVGLDRVFLLIYKHWDVYEHDVLSCHNTSLVDFMLNRKNWATACEIKAAAELYEKPITVYLSGTIGTNSTSKYTKTKYNESVAMTREVPTINLLLTNGHFQMLKLLRKHASSVSGFQMHVAKSGYQTSTGSNIKTYASVVSDSLKKKPNTSSVHPQALRYEIAT